MDMVRRILKSVEFIESNLVSDLEEDQLGVQEIAKMAAFSPWHFQRIFVSVTGETVANYVRKRRLTIALDKLENTREGILDIALACHYESQESFTRAFQLQFGITPGQVRKGGFIPASNTFKARLTSEYLNHLNKEKLMEPRFANFPEMKVVGYGAKFICIMSPDHNNEKIIGPLWDRLLENIHLIGQRTAARTIGCCTPLERTGERRNHADECYYVACAEVNNTNEIPDGMEAVVIPAGRYAIFTHRGKLDTLEHTLRFIYGPWLLKSGAQLRDVPDLEIYDDRFNSDSDDSEFDICIPIM
jgi:AraC family transcriptional regulator